MEVEGATIFPRCLPFAPHASFAPPSASVSTTVSQGFSSGHRYKYMVHKTLQSLVRV